MRYLLLVILAGCGTMTEVEREQREYNQGIDRENYALCAQVYKQYRMPMYHVDHTHGSNDKVHSRWIRYDLVVNNCKTILGEYWATK